MFKNKILLIFSFFIFINLFCSFSYCYEEFSVLPSYQLNCAHYSTSDSESDTFKLAPKSIFSLNTFGGKTSSIRLPHSLTNKKFIVWGHGLSNSSSNKVYIIYSDSEFTITADVQNNLVCNGSNISYLLYTFRTFSSDSFYDYIVKNIDSPVETSDSVSCSLGVSPSFMDTNILSKFTTSNFYDIWFGDFSPVSKPTIFISNFDLYIDNHEPDFPVFVSSYKDMVMPYLNLKTAEDFYNYTRNNDAVVDLFLGNDIGGLPSYMEISYQGSGEGLPKTKDVFLCQILYYYPFHYNSSSPIGRVSASSSGLRSTKNLSSYIGSSEFSSITDGTRIKIDFYYYYYSTEKLWSLEYTVGDDSSIKYIDAMGNVRTPENPLPSDLEPDPEPEPENPNKELLEKQDEMIEQQKEQNETSKGIWETLKDLLSYINPFSENFFVYKLIELLIDALKSLFIPSDDFFGNWFADLNNSFKDQFGIVYYPVSCVVDFLNALNAKVSEQEPIIHVPEFSFDFMGSSTVFFDEYNYNFNSLLVNDNFKRVHDFYLFFVNIIFTVGLIVLAGKIGVEIFGGVGDEVSSAVSNSDSARVKRYAHDDFLRQKAKYNRK